MFVGNCWLVEQGQSLPACALSHWDAHWSRYVKCWSGGGREGVEQDREGGMGQ